jgi:Flp pilus assembly protein TadD
VGGIGEGAVAYGAFAGGSGAVGKLNLRDTSAQTNLVLARAVQGDPRTALAILQRAVADNPDQALAWMNLGMIHQALGNE